MGWQCITWDYKVKVDYKEKSRELIAELLEG